MLFSPILFRTCLAVYGRASPLIVRSIWLTRTVFRDKRVYGIVSYAAKPIINERSSSSKGYALGRRQQFSSAPKLASAEPAQTQPQKRRRIVRADIATVAVDTGYLHSCLKNEVASFILNHAPALLLLPSDINWLQSSYEIREGSAIPCDAIYDRYKANCERSDLSPMCEAQFGKLVHNQFASEGLHWIQLRNGKSRRSFYEGLSPSLSSEAKLSEDAVVVDLAKKPSAKTVQWLRNKFEVEAGFAIPCGKMFEDYLRNCKKCNVRPLTNKMFGRIVRRTFSSHDMGRHQFDTGTQRTTHYEGLRLLDAPTSDESCYHVHMDLATKPSPVTSRWLQESIVPAPGFAVRCSTAYKCYALHCKENNLRRLTDAHFGRLLRTTFGSIKLRVRHFGNKKSGGFYSGVRMNCKHPSVADDLKRNTISPTRWGVLEDMKSSCATPLLLPLPLDVVLELEMYRSHSQSFERLRMAYFGACQGTTETLHTSVEGKKNSIDYQINKRVPGLVMFDLRSICKTLASFDTYLKAYLCVFTNWRDELISEDRDKCFVGDSCVPRQPKINDYLTSYGVGRLLRFYENSSRRRMSCLVRKLLTDAGLLSPFKPLPVAIKAEVLTTSRILAAIHNVYPDLIFKKYVVLGISGGHKPRRILDLWCEELKLNIECNERNHEDPFIYPEDYTAKREEDIRSVKGAETSFHYYDPHDVNFFSDKEAVKICSLIAELAVSMSIYLRRQTTADTSVSQVSIVRDTAMPIGDKLLTSNELTRVRDRAFESLATIHELRNSYLQSYAGNMVHALRISVKERHYSVYFAIDNCTGKAPVVTFHRVSLCKAIAGKDRFYGHLFTIWSNGTGKHKKDKFFVAPQSHRRVRGAPPDTESLTVDGVLSLLDYYEATLPENVSIIRQSLIDSALILPYYINEEPR